MRKTPNINKILALPINKGCSDRGADMGRRNRIGESARLYLQRINFIDGDYDAGGAYWGGGSSLYCAFNDDTMVFVRAKNRKEAKNKLPELNKHGFFK